MICLLEEERSSLFRGNVGSGGLDLIDCCWFFFFDEGGFLNVRDTGDVNLSSGFLILCEGWLGKRKRDLEKRVG